MKKTLLTIIATTMLFGCIGNEESQVRENGVLSVEFDEGCATCPVLTGPSISSPTSNVTTLLDMLAGYDGSINSQAEIDSLVDNWNN